MENAIADKSLAFAVRVVNLYRSLQIRISENVISVQILKSGTSIGANVREANSAQSRADFIAKLSIALKECDETGYWLELLRKISSITEIEFDSIENDRKELFALLTAILKSTKARMSECR